MTIQSQAETVDPDVVKMKMNVASAVANA